MENYIGEQLTYFGAAVLLGMWEALIYDLMRPVRLRRREDRKLTHLLDGLYVLGVLVTLFWFTLRFGGELRLYMLLGTVLGAIFYLWAPGRLLRPIWDFWADVGTDFLHRLWAPFRLLGGVCKKIHEIEKKHFHFQKKYATIKNYRRDLKRLYPITPRERRHRGRGRKKEAEKTEKTGKSPAGSGTDRADLGGRRQGRSGLRKAGRGPR